MIAFGAIGEFACLLVIFLFATFGRCSGRRGRVFDRVPRRSFFAYFKDEFALDRYCRLRSVFLRFRHHLSRTKENGLSMVTMSSGERSK